MKDCPFCTESKITLSEIKKKYVEHILKLCGHKKVRASKVLGINPRLLRHWVALGKINSIRNMSPLVSGYKSITSTQRDKFSNRSRY